MASEKKPGAAAQSTDHAHSDRELYFQGNLPVYAGRFRRRIIGYFTGHIPPGTRIGREVRLVKLPELNWVYGHLIATPDGPALYVPNASMMESIEGFIPLRSGREIRASSAPPLPPKSTSIEQPISDDDFDDLTDLTIIEPKDLIDPDKY